MYSSLLFHCEISVLCWNNHATSHPFCSYHDFLNTPEKLPHVLSIIVSLWNKCIFCSNNHTTYHPFCSYYNVQIPQNIYILTPPLLFPCEISVLSVQIIVQPLILSVHTAMFKYSRIVALNITHVLSICFSLRHNCTFCWNNHAMNYPFCSS